MSGHVAATAHEGVLEITFENARRRNALSLSLLSALSRAIDDARAGDVRAVVLAGAGDGFSAGADLGDLTGTIDDRAMDDAIGRAAASIRDCPVPVIAAVEGPCIGGALEVALSCDAIVAAEGAYFALPATHLGLLYDPRAVARLRLRLSPAALRWVLLLGERIDAGPGGDGWLRVSSPRARGARRGRWPTGIGSLAHARRGPQEALNELGGLRRLMSGPRSPRHPRSRTPRAGRKAKRVWAGDRSLEIARGEGRNPMK